MAYGFPSNQEKAIFLSTLEGACLEAGFVKCNPQPAAQTPMTSEPYMPLIGKHLKYLQSRI